jgi:hypothetical protein
VLLSYLALVSKCCVMVLLKAVENSGRLVCLKIGLFLYNVPSETTQDHEKRLSGPEANSGT